MTAADPKRRRLPTWALITIAALVGFGIGAGTVGPTVAGVDAKQIASLQQDKRMAQDDADSAKTDEQSLNDKLSAQQSEANQLTAREAAVKQREDAVAAAESALKATQFTDGTWRVGADVQPGTYRATDVTDCYWARLSDLSGGVDSILANGNVASGQIVVTLKSTDAGFESNRCGTWTKVG